jgi:hypothetical protein
VVDTHRLQSLLARLRLLLAVSRLGVADRGPSTRTLMTSAPYATAQRVFWIVDNGSSRRRRPSIDRLQPRRPTLRLIHLP